MFLPQGIALFLLSPQEQFLKMLWKLLAQCQLLPATPSPASTLTPTTTWAVSKVTIQGVPELKKQVLKALA